LRNADLAICSTAGEVAVMRIRTYANRRSFTAEHAESAEIFSFLGVLSGLGGEKWIRLRKFWRMRTIKLYGWKCGTIILNRPGGGL